MVVNHEINWNFVTVPTATSQNLLFHWNFLFRCHFSIHLMLTGQFMLPSDRSSKTLLATRSNSKHRPLDLCLWLELSKEKPESYKGPIFCCQKVTFKISFWHKNELFDMTIPKAKSPQPWHWFSFQFSDKWP
jgi:hypothetical protein